MSESRSLRAPSVDPDQTQQRSVLNRSLLLAAVLIGALAGAEALAGVANSPAESGGLALGAGGLLVLLVAYLLGRGGRLRLAGGLLVLLLLVSGGVALGLAPASAQAALLPLMTLPVALAALLLPRPAAYLAALAAALVAAGALSAQPLLGGQSPAALLQPQVWLAPAALLASALLLVLVIGAPRRTIQTLAQHLERQAAAQAQAEQALRAAQAATDELRQRQARQARQHDALVDGLTDGALAVDPRGRVARASAAAQAIWAGLDGAPLAGLPLETVQHALSLPGAGVELVVLEQPATHEDGYTHLLRDRRDQTRFQRLRDDLLGLLADEMRNPLTSVVTALDLTLGQRNLPEDLDRVLLGARRSGQRLLDLVNIVLEIDQIGQDAAALRRTPTSICRVLDASVAQVAPLAQQGAVTVAVEYNADSTVLLDGERMQRAFAHLLEYALRHSPPYSTLHVRTERQGDVALVRISDQGPGLTQQQREALFEWRAAHNRGGPVLGLAFSKVLIEAHGGQLAIESNSGGQGASAVVAIPIDARLQPDLALQAGAGRSAA